MQHIESHLLKPSPDHVSVVGPAHYGKSVLLRHLADAHHSGSSHYLTTAHIHLRHDIPASDSAFKQRFAEAVREALQAAGSDLSDWVDVEDENIHELLGLVFDELEGKRVRLLVVLDGLDYVLAATGLTRNLWDQLRVLAQKPSLRLVTGSRRPLRELCRTEESRTSDFWEIFYDEPVRVAVLGDADWPAFLQPLRDGGCVFDESARKEIANWTGGVPVLVCAVLQKLWEDHPGESISKLEIDRAANTMLDGRREVLATLWEDCNHELHADLGVLSARDIPCADLSDSRRRTVEERGFGRVSSNRLRGSCRLMQRYAKEQAPALADLNRLFGTASGFETHIRSLLELRLIQIKRPHWDEELHASVSNAVRAVSPAPEQALTWVRSIANRVLTLIWQAELPPDRTLPAEWLDEWRSNGLDPRDDRGRLPRGAGPQCHILRLVTGSDRTRRQSKYVTKTTYLFVDHLQSVGDFGQHRSDFPNTKVTIGFSAAVVLAAISLVESLTGDLEAWHS
ncbi:MAG: ATP-binding protein [Deltaproteobacteria bacterium]|nr:ATP-binding protein [Deltaproteobacteria bacterium]